MIFQVSLTSAHRLRKPKTEKGPKWNAKSLNCLHTKYAAESHIIRFYLWLLISHTAVSTREVLRGNLHSRANGVLHQCRIFLIIAFVLNVSGRPRKHIPFTSPVLLESPAHILCAPGSRVGGGNESHR